MTLAYRTEENSPLVLTLCQDTVICSGLNLNVDERDEMFGFFYYGQDGDRDRALAMYFHSGLLIWETFRAILAWRFGAEIPGRLLDFASGYGRVTRFVVQEIPAERVWVSDIYEEGVAFQVEQYGVHGLVSTADPADFVCAERFDTILVSSLFTHLPDSTFRSWLRRLWELRAPTGMLVFSVHSPDLLAAGTEMPASGFLFQEVSESGSLAKSQYGSCWVTEDFVRGVIAEIAPGASAHRIPRGLVNFQDLWVVVEESGADFSGLAVRATPEGFVDHCSWIPPDGLEVSGWVVDRATGEPVRAVQGWVGDRLLQSSAEFSPREDAASAFVGAKPLHPQGWRLRLAIPPGISRSACLHLRVIDSQGRESTLYASTIDAALLRSARLDLLTTTERLVQTRAEGKARLEQLRGECAYERSVLEARIAAMEASRFWTLRQRWFRLKRFLRWTDQP
jgi:SAM-dependent methyltransferase